METTASRINSSHSEYDSEFRVIAFSYNLCMFEKAMLFSLIKM